MGYCCGEVGLIGIGTATGRAFYGASTWRRSGVLGAAAGITGALGAVVAGRSDSRAKTRGAGVAARIGTAWAGTFGA